jgi:hypothetical protein
VERIYPDWLEFHSARFGGPVAGVRARSGVVRVEIGGGETVERVQVGLPDDEAWAGLATTLDATGFWEWPSHTAHREPHRPEDWYWWLEVRWDGRRHLAAGWNEAPERFDRLRLALFDLVEQVVK